MWRDSRVGHQPLACDNLFSEAKRGRKPERKEAYLEARSLKRKESLVPHYTAAVTLLAVAFYFFLATGVATARSKFGVKLPATTGNPDFERVFRLHQNTLEWLPTFLVPLWLCALYLNDAVAAVLGLVWIAGRILYYLGYRDGAAKRLPGFYIQTAACLLLFIGAVVGLVLHW